MDERRKDDDEKVKVAIIDSGIDSSHPDFHSYKFGAHNTRDWTGSSATHDSVGHGTHAAGLIHRVAPEAELYIAKTFIYSDGDASTPHRVAEVSTSPKFSLDPGSRDKQAIRYASSPQGWGVNIITMSFGFHQRDEDVAKAVREAHVQGVIMFAAASNYGAIEGKRTAFPANIVGQVIKISSTDGWGSKSRWNPSESKNDDNFSVLGEAVRSAWPAHLNQGTDQRKSGTSIATPIAAGIAALVLEFAIQRPQYITNRDREILWRYEGMRAIFAKMATPKDGFSWVVPWTLFKVDWDPKDISNRITYELQECGYI